VVRLWRIFGRRYCSAAQSFL